MSVVKFNCGFVDKCIKRFMNDFLTLVTSEKIYREDGQVDHQSGLVDLLFWKWIKGGSNQKRNSSSSSQNVVNFLKQQ